LTYGQPALTLGQTLWLLSPELVLLLASLLILGLDALRPRREGKWRAHHVALAGLSGALIATISLWGCHARVLHVLSCDNFALVIKMFALVTIGLVVLLSDAYLRSHSFHEDVGARFPRPYALLLFSALVICLLGAAANLIVILLSCACLSLVACILTIYLRDDRRSTEAAIKYFVYSAALAAVMLYGMSWLYGATGSTDLGAIAVALAESESVLRPVVLPALIMLLVGLACLVAAAPFHQWAPDAYEGAPIPVAAFLSVGPALAGFAFGACIADRAAGGSGEPDGGLAGVTNGVGSADDDGGQSGGAVADEHQATTGLLQHRPDWLRSHRRRGRVGGRGDGDAAPPGGLRAG